MKKLDFCENWRFKKVGEDKFQTVNLPHDASFYEGRSSDSPGGSANGYFKGGIYEYEKTFFAPMDWQDKVIMFQFGGVYKNSDVAINGKHAGGCAYGYSEFAVSAEGLLDFGKDNTITVTADNSELPTSRWYTGAGIHQPVTMLVGNKLHIKRRGVKISTLQTNPVIIRVETKHTDGSVSVEISDGNTIVAKGEGDIVELTIENARLWSDEQPNLYTCHVKLSNNNEVQDEVVETFGIRHITWSNKGLFINGKETLLRGGCIHSDNGILGACSYPKAEERKVKILKQAGYNALRASHNPASEALLDACDKYGMYVMDETWDMWYSHKSPFDYAKDFMQNYKFDIHSLVERDFNHPSVIMYSIGNEVSEPATARGVELTKELVAEFHKLDSSRPVTAGINLFVISRSAKGNAIYKEGGGLNREEKDMSKMNSTMFNMMTSFVGTGMNRAANSRKVDAITKPCLDALDIAGYNYASGRYPKEAKANPNRVIVGSETFPQSIVKNWAMVKKFPYLIGDFMWTAWDYLGEAGIGAWAYTADGKGFNKPYPWILADTGAFDILGNPTGEAFLAKTVWGFSDMPIIAVQPIKDTKPAKAVWRGTNAIPSWSWQGQEGKRAVIEVYSNAAKIELLLNGKSLGKKRVKDFVAYFKVKYASGKLTAIAFDSSGNETGRSELVSASGKLGISVNPEDAAVRPGEIVYVPISLVGENGSVESNADRKLSVAVEGGDLLGFGSANPRTEETYTSGTFTTYYGKALAVVRSKVGNKVQITVSGENFADAIAEINVYKEEEIQ